MDAAFKLKLDKLRMMGIDIFGYNEWGIVIHDKQGYTVLNTYNNTSCNVENSETAKPLIYDHFIVIDYQYLYKSNNGSRYVTKNSLFTKYTNKDILKRNSVLSSLKPCRVKSNEIMEIRNRDYKTITLINYRGKRLRIPDPSLNAYSSGYLIKALDNKYYYLDSNLSAPLGRGLGVAVSEVDKDLNYIKPFDSSARPTIRYI